MRRVLLALVVGSLAFALTLAAAATLTVNNSSLGAGSSATSTCDPTVGISYATTYTAGTGYTVSSVIITALDTAACAGKTVGVTLADGGNDSLGNGSAPVPGSGTTADVLITGSPQVSQVANAHVVIG